MSKKYSFNTWLPLAMAGVLAVSVPAAVIAKQGADISHGKTVYEETCIACHGENGAGAVPGAPNFTDKNGRLTKPDEVLIEHAVEGFQTPGSPMGMPELGGNPDLTDQDIADVIAYIRQAFGK